MKNILLVICGLAFVLGGCQNEMHVREAKKEEKKAEAPGEAAKPAPKEAPEQK